MSFPKPLHRRRASKQSRLNVGDPSAALVARMQSFQQQARSRQVELLTRQLALEKRLATLVEDAYALTTEERLLLRSTRPIRDPIDVLETRTQGTRTTGITEPADRGAANG